MWLRLEQECLPDRLCNHPPWPVTHDCHMWQCDTWRWHLVVVGRYGLQSSNFLLGLLSLGNHWAWRQENRNLAVRRTPTERRAPLRILHRMSHVCCHSLVSCVIQKMLLVDDKINIYIDHNVLLQTPIMITTRNNGSMKWYKCNSNWNYFVIMFVNFLIFKLLPDQYRLSSKH